MKSYVSTFLLALFSFYSASAMNINFHTLESDEPSTLTGLRLVQRSDQPYLLLSRESRLFEAPLPAQGGGEALALTEAVELGGFPEWDAKPLPGEPGVCISLYIEGHSAVSWAKMRLPGAEVLSSPAEGTFSPPGRFMDDRLHQESFAVYGQPRFAKGQRPDQWSVTAVSSKDGMSLPIVFPRDGIEGVNEFEVGLGEYPDSIEDARLVCGSSCYWLFLLMGDPDPMVDGKSRDLPSGARGPSALSMVELDDLLTPLGDPIRLFDSASIYEFDVDASPDGRLTVFATTNEGAIVAQAKPESGDPMPEAFWKTIPLEKPLCSPSVMVLGGASHIAAIENFAQPEAAVVAGTLSTD